MRVIGLKTWRQRPPILHWVQEKVVGPAYDLDADSGYQTVWRVRSAGAAADSRQLAALRPGDWVFLPRGRRQQRFQPGTRLLSIGYRAGETHMPDGWFDRAGAVVLRNCLALERASLRLHLCLTAEVSEQMHMYAQLNDLTCPIDGWLRITAEFHRWLAIVAQTLEGRGVAADEEAELDPRVAAALDRIERDPWSQDVRPSRLADGASLSRRRLEQLFRSQLGSGVAQHRRRLQVQRARALLDDRGRQVKEVAHELGFASAAAFSTWFRRGSGRSPSSHRAEPPPS